MAASWPLKALWPNFQVLQILKKEKEIEPFDVISENSSPKGFFWPNKKKSVISLLSAESRYFRTYTLKVVGYISGLLYLVSFCLKLPSGLPDQITLTLYRGIYFATTKFNSGGSRGGARG